MTFREMVLHHIVNRSDNGQSDLRNLTPRHKRCESHCHATYRHGNPEEGEGYVLRKRRCQNRVKNKGKHSHLPGVRREIPYATFRKVSKSRPLPRVSQILPSRCSPSIEERLKRIEDLLFPSDKEC